VATTAVPNSRARSQRRRFGTSLASSPAPSREQFGGADLHQPSDHSEPPRAKKHKGIALTPAQQDLLIKVATGPWCLGAILEVSAATGARRGEVLALRWADVQDGRVSIARSLTQTAILQFKGTKTEEPRRVSLLSSAQIALEVHRESQAEFRRQFGPDYWSDLDLIFSNPDATPWKPDSVSASVSALFRRLKLPKGASLHSLRHTHGSHLPANGVSLQNAWATPRFG
jgi:integrase